MKTTAQSPEEMINSLPDDRKEAISTLRQIILKNLPEGFTEEMSYGMISYVVPKSRYPDGYHANSNEPLPFISIASQKNHIGLYHMGIYINTDILNWFSNEYKSRVPSKLDVGKSCIRFKKVDQIPYDLVGELVSKITVDEWIDTYERYKTIK